MRVITLLLFSIVSASAESLIIQFGEEIGTPAFSDQEPGILGAGPLYCLPPQNVIETSELDLVLPNWTTLDETIVLSDPLMQTIIYIWDDELQVFTIVENPYGLAYQFWFNQWMVGSNPPSVLGIGSSGGPGLLFPPYWPTSPATGFTVEPWGTPLLTLAPEPGTWLLGLLGIALMLLPALTRLIQGARLFRLVVDHLDRQRIHGHIDACETAAVVFMPGRVQVEGPFAPSTVVRVEEPAQASVASR